MNKLNDVLEDLYNGNININLELSKSDEYSKILRECNTILKKVENKLNEEDKKILNKYIEKKSQMVSLECKEKFIEGYKLASRLIIAGIK